MSTQIVQRVFGGPETLEVVDVTPPSAADVGPDEVLVRVAAAGVNQIDVMTRTGGGMAAAGIITLPYTPGWDVAGIVEAVGSAVAGLSPGQRVLGLARFPKPGSAYAEHVIIPAADLVPAPENLSDDQAAALPMAAMTAWQAFTDTTAVQPGQRVLITGAGGGVGHLAVQLAHHLGARVIAVASSGKHEWLRELGADETVDYRDGDAIDALAGMVDVTLSLAAGSRDTALRAVRTGGTLIALGGGAEGLEAAAKQAGVGFAATHVHTQRDWLTAIADLAAHGVLVPTVSEVFDLADAADAHRAIESGHSTGKIVLRTNSRLGS
ncbi:NADP-dependent oxidoreductase [Gordonia hydrophobica]|uniref:NADP-dependent oxidoreductase n=1 Tax=Gordonia hydrophobica TaxID=40516 RepID=A0ABZ2U139_9ACTN|nr:NADP-dependent oxidoreductase [Gordonia hydrophobica]MBM7368397.1 NADPH:quinone reductase-like Zn-dependent oxidoreductase [Gordonia hydrophobica]